MELFEDCCCCQAQKPFTSICKYLHIYVSRNGPQACLPLFDHSTCRWPRHGAATTHQGHVPLTKTSRSLHPQILGDEGGISTWFCCARITLSRKETTPFQAWCLMQGKKSANEHQGRFGVEGELTSTNDLLLNPPLANNGEEERQGVDDGHRETQLCAHEMYQYRVQEDSAIISRASNRFLGEVSGKAITSLRSTIQKKWRKGKTHQPGQSAERTTRSPSG